MKLFIINEEKQCPICKHYKLRHKGESFRHQTLKTRIKEELYECMNCGAEFKTAWVEEEI